jgi:hypothetical protein
MEARRAATGGHHLDRADRSRGTHDRERSAMSEQTDSESTHINEASLSGDGTADLAFGKYELDAKRTTLTFRAKAFLLIWVTGKLHPLSGMPDRADRDDVTEPPERSAGRRGRRSGSRRPARGRSLAHQIRDGGGHQDWTLFETCFTADCDVRYGERRWQGVDQLRVDFAEAHDPLDESMHRVLNIAVHPRDVGEIESPAASATRCPVDRRDPDDPRRR